LISAGTFAFAKISLGETTIAGVPHLSLDKPETLLPSGKATQTLGLPYFLLSLSASWAQSNLRPLIFIHSFSFHTNLERTGRCRRF